MKKRVIALTLLFVILSAALVFASGAKEAPIVVLYTNDVHCGYETNIPYTAVAAYKKSVLEETPYVALVDIGDAIQGETVGTVSRGLYPVQMMNAVGYDLAIFGNHEFDYGMERLAELVKEAKYKYINGTISYTGEGKSFMSKLKPYQIVKYGKTKVAFIGVTTHDTLRSSTPKYFMEDGEFVYNFASGQALYDRVQSLVDTVRKKGADYVVVMSHLGNEEDLEPDRSMDLIANTTGIDVLLDGHEHAVVESGYYTNAAGQKVLYSQTGTKLKNLGKLTINPLNKTITAEFVHPEEEDPEAKAVIDAIKEEYELEVKKVVAHSEIELPVSSPEGIRLVRNRESLLGDLDADAYRIIAGADIGFANGGGLRAALHAGDITLDDIIKVHPFGNYLCMCYATGQEILDALEWGSKNVEAKPDNGTKAIGESGGFLDVSGLKYTIDTSIKSTCVADADGLFVGVAGARRVKDVFVGSEEEGWTPIDPDKTYTLASHNYKLQDLGDGYTMFADNEYILDNVMLDNQVLINYITDYLGGVIRAEDYGTLKGRITVI